MVTGKGAGVPFLVRPTRQLICRLPQRHRVDDHLHRALDARLAEDEHELVDALRHQRTRVHGLQDVNAVFLQQGDMPVEDLVARLRRHHFDAPGVGADRDGVESGEEDRRRVIQAGFSADPGFGI